MFFSEDVDLRHKLLNLLWQLKLINFRFTISPMLPLLYWSIFDNNKSSRERKLNIFTAIWIACEYSHLSSFVHHLSQKTKQAQLLKVLSVILKLQTGWIFKGICFYRRGAKRFSTLSMLTFNLSVHFMHWFFFFTWVGSLPERTYGSSWQSFFRFSKLDNFPFRNLSASITESWICWQICISVKWKLEVMFQFSALRTVVLFSLSFGCLFFHFQLLDVLWIFALFARLWM